MDCQMQQQLTKTTVDIVGTQMHAQVSAKNYVVIVAWNCTTGLEVGLKCLEASLQLLQHSPSFVPVRPLCSCCSS